MDEKKKKRQRGAKKMKKNRTGRSRVKDEGDGRMTDRWIKGRERLT